MTLPSILLGFLIGFAEIAMTGLISDAVLSNSPKKAVIPAVIKLLLYGGGITVAVMTSEIEMLRLGMGFGVGMFCGCVGYILFKSFKEKKKAKSDSNGK